MIGLHKLCPMAASAVVGAASLTALLLPELAEACKRQVVKIRVDAFIFIISKPNFVCILKDLLCKFGVKSERIGVKGANKMHFLEIFLKYCRTKGKSLWWL